MYNKPYVIKLRITVNAWGVQNAYDMGVQYAEHLFETMNDDDSIQGEIGIIAESALFGGLKGDVPPPVPQKTAHAIHLVERILQEPRNSEPRRSLLELLVQMGNLTQEQRETSYFEDPKLSIEHSCVHIYHDGGTTQVNTDGTLEAFPN